MQKSPVFLSEVCSVHMSSYRLRKSHCLFIKIKTFIVKMLLNPCTVDSVTFLTNKDPPQC